MSASILPSVPPTTPSRANDQGGPSGGSIKSAVQETTPVKDRLPAPSTRQEILLIHWVKCTPIDPEFLKNHLQPVPANAFDQTTKYMINADVMAIMKVKKVEKPIYAPLASVLTTMSKSLYNTLSNNQKQTFRNRHQIPPDAPGHLTFIDHHTSPPIQFPDGAVMNCCKVIDKPDLVAAFAVSDFQHKEDPTGGYDSHQVYSGVPHHRIEAIVEAKALNDKTGREQLITYLYRHHQARPDHPGVFGLTVGPRDYQVAYSYPNGVIASPRIPWENLEVLAAYVYSHYFPPPGHFLWDDTIQWVASENGSSIPTWDVQVKGLSYPSAQLAYLGEPWSRRTTILCTKDQAGDNVILKDMYRQDCSRFKEDLILEKIHLNGDFLGVVRMQAWDEVKCGGEVIRCFGQQNQSSRTKVRFALLDSGVNLLQAQSVNDLLKAIYDALEVHRTLYNERRVLHRDMSFYNILMYPKRGHSSRPVSNTTPLFIEDMLRGTEQTTTVFPTCLVIDFDNAADLEYDGDDDHEEGAHDACGVPKERTGTPMFIARSVNLQRVLKIHTGPQMPLLNGDALNLYKATHGEHHYDRYNDKLRARKVGTKGKIDTKGKASVGYIVRTQGSVGTQGKVGIKGKVRAQDKVKTIHGGIPPAEDPRDCAPEQLPAFKHRAEHDVESIYWTMVYTLLCVHPRDTPRETDLSDSSRVVWDILLSHHIPKPNCDVGNEKRGLILDRDLSEWQALFCDKMKDVAFLLNAISKHIIPEYALWEDELKPDHLHEALQRLILQYLVDHRNNNISLDPECLRPMPEVPVPNLEGKTSRHSIAPSKFLPAQPAAKLAANNASVHQEGGSDSKGGRSIEGGRGAHGTHGGTAQRVTTSARDERVKTKRSIYVSSLADVAELVEPISVPAHATRVNFKCKSGDSDKPSKDIRGSNLQDSGDDDTGGIGESSGLNGEPGVSGELGQSAVGTGHDSGAGSTDAAAIGGSGATGGGSAAAETQKQPSRPRRAIGAISKRKDNFSTEGPRVSKRRKVDNGTADSGDGSSSGVNSRSVAPNAAAESTNQTFLALTTKSRSKRLEIKINKPIRRSQRIKEAAEKKAAELERSGQPEATVRGSVRRRGY